MEGKHKASRWAAIKATVQDDTVNEDTVVDAFAMPKPKKNIVFTEETTEELAAQQAARRKQRRRRNGRRRRRRRRVRGSRVQKRKLAF